MKTTLHIRAHQVLSGLTALTLSSTVIDIAAAQQSLAARGDPPQLVLSGGVGLEGRAQLAQHEKDANLKIVFTEPQGSYLADIAVRVFDRSGALVFDTPAAGPWLLAKLNPGSYRIVASDGRDRQERLVSVGPSLHIVHIRMPEQGGITGRPNT